MTRILHIPIEPHTDLATTSFREQLGNLLRIGAPTCMRVVVSGAHLSMIRAVLSDRGLFSARIFTITDLSFFFLLSLSRLISPLASNMKNIHEPSVGTLFQRTLTLSSIASLAIGIAISIAGPLMLTLTQEPNYIISGSYSFFPIYGLALFVDNIQRVTARLLTGLKYVALPLGVECIFFLMDAMLCGKMTDILGMSGVAASYLGTSFLVTAALWIYLSRAAWIKPFELLSRDTTPHEKVDSTLHLTQKGLYISLGVLLNYVPALTLLSCLTVEKANALGPAQVYSMLGGSVMIGLGVGVSTLVASSNRDSHDWKTIAKTGQIVAVSFLAVASLLVILSSKYLVNLFAGAHGSNELESDTAVFFLRMQTIVELLNGLKAISTAIHEADKNTEFPFRYNAFFVGVLNTMLILAAKYMGLNEKIIFSTQLEALHLVMRSPRTYRLYFNPVQNQK